MMAMTAMNDHDVFCTRAVPAAFTYFNTGPRAHFTALAAQFAPISVMALAADFHPAAFPAALPSHFATAFLRSAFIALNFAVRRRTLINGGSNLRSILSEGRCCDCNRRSGG
jgi:hypothetical protein